MSMLPAIVVEFISTVIHYCLNLKNNKFNVMLWCVLSIVMSLFISVKFMMKVSMIVFSRFYHKNTVHVH